MLSNSHSDIFTGVHVHEMRAPGVFRYLEGRGGDSFFLGGEQNQSDFLPLPQQVLKITKICKICHIFPNFSSFFPVYHFFSFHLFIPLSFFLYILGRTGGTLDQINRGTLPHHPLFPSPLKTPIMRDDFQFPNI